MKNSTVCYLFFCLFWMGRAFSADPAPASPASAQDAPTEWEFSVTPYLWATGLSGKTSQFHLPTVDIDASFDKIFDDLNFAAMVIGDARKGRYSVFGDVIYTDISSDGASPRGVLATSADVKATTFAGMIGVGYSVLKTSPHHLDLVAGARVWSVDTEVSFSGGVLHGRKRSDSATWVDALVGLRGIYAFNSKFYATGWGLIGAGGADLDWDVGLGFGYHFNDRFSATFGYRALGVDYRQGSFVFDVVQKGPMAGLTIRF